MFICVNIVSTVKYNQCNVVANEKTVVGNCAKDCILWLRDCSLRIILMLSQYNSDLYIVMLV